MALLLVAALRQQFCALGTLPTLAKSTAAHMPSGCSNWLRAVAPVLPSELDDDLLRHVPAITAILASTTRRSLRALHAALVRYTPLQASK
eukprot:1837429-Amphidinium_carterae.1